MFHEASILRPTPWVERRIRWRLARYSSAIRVSQYLQRAGDPFGTVMKAAVSAGVETFLQGLNSNKGTKGDMESTNLP